MDPDIVKSWLKREKVNGFIQCLLIGLLGLIAGVVVLFLTFWFTYAVIWFAWHGVTAVSELLFSKKLFLSHPYKLSISAGFLVLLFIQHFRSNRWYWGDYPKRDYVENAPGFLAHAGVVGALAVTLAYPGASANMIADILLSGPRLVTGSFNLVAQGFCWRRIDESGCANLLAFLQTRTEAVPYKELTSAGWEDWFEQLRCIDGVCFLEKGLVLSSELRNKLNSLQ